MSRAYFGHCSCGFTTDDPAALALHVEHLALTTLATNEGQVNQPVPECAVDIHHGMAPAYRTAWYAVCDCGWSKIGPAVPQAEAAGRAHLDSQIDDPNGVGWLAHSSLTAEDIIAAALRQQPDPAEVVDALIGLGWPPPSDEDDGKTDHHSACVKYGDHSGCARCNL